MATPPQHRNLDDYAAALGALLDLQGHRVDVYLLVAETGERIAGLEGVLSGAVTEGLDAQEQTTFLVHVTPPNARLQPPNFTLIRDRFRGGFIGSTTTERSRPIPTYRIEMDAVHVLIVDKGVRGDDT